MKAVVTGAEGFIGKNLIHRLEFMPDITICPYDVGTDPALLSEYIKDCDVIFHLAGVNRPQRNEEFMEGNCGFAQTVLDTIKDTGNDKAVIVVSSSKVGTEIKRSSTVSPMSSENGAVRITTRRSRLSAIT